MASLAWDERALQDLIRLADFLAKEDPVSADATLDLIEEAVGVLAGHPLIGRRVSGELREVVISRGRTGYLALYQYYPASDRVIVRAIRHQREAGFEDS
jgi:plasmid stabilization system protein ParE